VVAIGDVHGDYDQFVSVLRSAGLIDEQGKWSGGKAHLVQTGDVLDRGPDSRKVMDLLMRLEGEAKSAGGEVHALIGNHESMILFGDYRYLSPAEIAAFKDADSEKVRDEAWKEQKLDAAGRKRWEAENPLGMVEFRRAFGPTGVYGKWIRGHNAVVKIDGTLFLHGGISPKYADWTVRKINERVRRLQHLGFDVAEMEVVTEADGQRLRFIPRVVESGYHQERLFDLTGLWAGENQARRLLDDIREFRAELQSRTGVKPTENIAAVRWLDQRFEPVIAAIPPSMHGKLQAAELYHQILEHRWFLSEQEHRDVPMDEAIGSYVGDILVSAPDEQLRIDPPTGEIFLDELT